jgi:hypothetical protein
MDSVAAFALACHLVSVARIVYRHDLQTASVRTAAVTRAFLFALYVCVLPLRAYLRASGSRAVIGLRMSRKELCVDTVGPTTPVAAISAVIATGVLMPTLTVCYMLSFAARPAHLWTLWAEIDSRSIRYGLEIRE